ncbi:MAG: ribbon-helix-helix domain-containing protein [Verrucomicrobiae bacterium]|nr:ribbon-helix-helix domain-containing protein [Verrucomicrobiae bacterium]
MGLTAAIPVRLTKDIDDRLNAISAATGLSKSELIRKATEDLLRQIESTGTLSYPVALGESVVNYGSQIGKQHNVFTSARDAKRVPRRPHSEKAPKK